MAVHRQTEIAEVEAFLAGKKRLQTLGGDGLPKWDRSSFNDELGAFWNIEEEDGVVRAKLSFRCGKVAPVHPSISVIFQGKPIWRVDIDRPEVSHPNPPWAAKLGLPPFVQGPHEHNWPDNREFVSRSPNWDIPARRPIPPQVKHLKQALPWLADQINLTLGPDQRGFDVPPQAELGLFQ